MRNAPSPLKLLLCRRGWSATGGAERYLRRFAGGLGEADIETILVADERWPQESWTAGPIERLIGSGPEGLQAIRDRHPGAVLFSMERLPGADIFRAGDGLHSAWLERLAAEEGQLMDLFRRGRPMHRRLLALEKSLFGDPELRVVANSRMVARELIQAHHLDPARIAVIPNGYDAPDIGKEERRQRRMRLRSELSIPDEATVFLFVGSGWKRKGAQILVDAFHALQHEDAWLILAGKGKASGAAHPRIHLAGPVADPVDHYLAADVFVLPTLYDPFSNACLEAAAFGLPVLTTDANGFAEVIEAHPGSGEILPVPRSAPAWTAAMGRWTDPALRRGAEAPLTAIRAHHTVTRNVSATVDFIQKTLPARCS